jgi:hypothetical protein
VSLLTENGNTKDDLRLPTDDSLLTQVGFMLHFSFCRSFNLHFSTYLEAEHGDFLYV